VNASAQYLFYAIRDSDIVGEQTDSLLPQEEAEVILLHSPLSRVFARGLSKPHSRGRENLPALMIAGRLGSGMTDATPPCSFNCVKLYLNLLPRMFVMKQIVGGVMRNNDGNEQCGISGVIACLGGVSEMARHADFVSVGGGKTN